MSLNLSNQNLTKIEVEGNLLRCYRENELLQVCSLENVTSLDCSDNQLTSLPDTLPERLKVLDCFNNPLRYVPFFPKRPNILSVPEKFEKKHYVKRYSEYYQKQQLNRYLVQLFFSEMGFSEDFLELELE